MSSPESIRYFGQEMYTLISSTYPHADTSNPPYLDESWASLLTYLRYYIERGWEMS